MGNRSVNLETGEYVTDRKLMIEDAIHEVEVTPSGLFVNLVLAESHGNPDEYLVPVLTERFGDDIEIRFVDQCGCGGYVYRVTCK